MTRDLKILSFSLLTWGIGEAFFIYTQTLYMEQLGADALTIGGILALAALGMTLTHIPAGALADRVGSRRIIRVNWVFSLAAAILMYLANGLTIFTIGLVLYQFTGFVLSPLSAYISSARGKWSASRALTTTYAMFSIGGFIGSSLGWYMGDLLSLQAGYGLAMIIFVVSTVSIFLLKDQPIEIQRPTGNFAALRKRPDFRRFLIISALILFSAYLSWPLTPNYLHDIRSVSTDMIRFLGALYSLGTAVLSLLISRLESRRGILVAQILMATSVGMLWLGGSAPLFAAGYFLAGGFRVNRALLTSRVESMVSPANKGLAFGILETVSGVTLTIAPPVAGYLYQIFPALPFPVSLSLIGFTLIIVTTLYTRQEPVSVPS